jgi:hypothetical protein
MEFDPTEATGQRPEDTANTCVSLRLKPNQSINAKPRVSPLRAESRAVPCATRLLPLAFAVPFPNFCQSYVRADGFKVTKPSAFTGDSAVHESQCASGLNDVPFFLPCRRDLTGFGATPGGDLPGNFHRSLRDQSKSEARSVPPEPQAVLPHDESGLAPEKAENPGRRPKDFPRANSA